jgi:hypothetical protein
MKSALANVGELRLSSVAREFEQFGKNKDITIILSETPSFISSLKDVIEKIKETHEDMREG